MKKRTPCIPDQTFFRSLMLDMAQEHAVDSLLALVVHRLAALDQVALARIWTIEPGDICPTCPMRDVCDDRERCLHLRASAGNPQSEPDANWSRLDGGYRRFPLGARKVGTIGASGEPLMIRDVPADSRWIANQDWARSEKIRGFYGQPIIFRDEVLGVVAIFTRSEPCDEDFESLRIVADYAAAALVNARSFEQIRELQHQIELENAYLQDEVREVSSYGEIIGKSSAIRTTTKQIELVAEADATVLITGESGTGKELVARALHMQSERRDRPLIKVNCASVAKDLFESEFFGHVKGSFTGAVKDRAGRFRLADGGTLFLDEVGEIPLPLQSKLLRVLQEGEYERVGDEATHKVDTRVIAATNRDLQEEIEQGRFREDLYYRLNVFPIDVAPLRRRKEDIPLLAAHFVEQTARRLNTEPPPLTQANVMQLQSYAWPGNIRELQNVIERAMIVARGGRLHFDLEPDDDAPRGPAPRHQDSAAPPESTETVLSDAEMRVRERRNLRLALEQTGWRVYGPHGAAALLGLQPTTLVSRMKKAGLQRPR